MSISTKKTIKINLILGVMCVLYSVSLFLCSNLLNGLESFNSNLKTSIEQSWRQQARLTLSNVIDRFSYAIEHDKLDANNIEEVAEWCKINYQGITNGSQSSDGFVVELNSNNLIISGHLIDISKEDSIKKYLKLENIDIKDRSDTELIKNVINNIEKFLDTKYNDNNYWINNGKEEWIEWKIYPTSILGKDDYINIDGNETSLFNKYVFVLRTNANDIYSYYTNIIHNIDMYINIVHYALVISLIFIIVFIFYITYNEFNSKNKQE